MIRLDSTTRKLQIVLGGAVTTNQLPVVLSWSDKTTSSYTGGSTVSNTNNTTAVDIAAAPGASTVRDIDHVSINNIDTAVATVTVRYNDNGTTYTIVKVTLSVGDQLIYTHAAGWVCMTSAGAVKPYQDVATVTIAAGSKTTPVDADLIPIVDSAASNILAKLTWANLKATLKTYFDTLYPGSLATDQTWTGAQRGTITTDNDLSFDLNASNNFFCTPTAGGALTFTNHVSGQSGYILFVNSTNYAITAAATTKVDDSFLGLISTTGTYLIAYLDNGTNTYCTATQALA